MYQKFCQTLEPDLQFMPQLTIQQINLANCSEEELQLKPDQEILTLNFPTKQILGIKRDLTLLLNNQTMDRNILNYHFLKNTL